MKFKKMFKSNWKFQKKLKVDHETYVHTSLTFRIITIFLWICGAITWHPTVQTNLIN